MNGVIVLLSGGVDSTVLLARELAMGDGRECFTLTANYGQRHNCEIAAAMSISSEFGVVNYTSEIDLSFLQSPLLTSSAELTKSLEELRSPVTWTVPGRNSILLSLALSLSEVVKAARIVIGFTSEDTPFIDCRAKFTSAFNTIADLGTVSRPHIHAPLLGMSKAQVVKIGSELGVDFSKTVTCYRPVLDESTIISCGTCPACITRQRAFVSANIADPAVYGVEY